jgi:hypothetical protein
VYVWRGVVFETGSHYVTQAEFELLILLSQPLGVTGIYSLVE